MKHSSASKSARNLMHKENRKTVFKSEINSQKNYSISFSNLPTRSVIRQQAAKISPILRNLRRGSAKKALSADSGQARRQKSAPSTPLHAAFSPLFFSFSRSRRQRGNVVFYQHQRQPNDDDTQPQTKLTRLAALVLRGWLALTVYTPVYYVGPCTGRGRLKRGTIAFLNGYTGLHPDGKLNEYSCGRAKLMQATLHDPLCIGARIFNYGISYFPSFNVRL